MAEAWSRIKKVMKMGESKPRREYLDFGKEVCDVLSSWTDRESSSLLYDGSDDLESLSLETS